MFNDLIEVTFVILYKARANFKSTDARYLSISEGDKVTGLYSTHGWVFAVKEEMSKQIGFVPESYLEFEKKVK